VVPTLVCAVKRLTPLMAGACTGETPGTMGDAGDGLIGSRRCTVATAWSGVAVPAVYDTVASYRTSRSSDQSTSRNSP